MTTKELQETINKQDSRIATLSETITELETANANLQAIVDSRDLEVERLGDAIDELTEQLNETVTVEDSGHNDPGVERETKVERQRRLRRRVKRD